MPDISNTPTQQQVKQDTKEMMEFSVVNQAYFLYVRQDKFLTAFHDAHDKAVAFDPSGLSLIICLSHLKHACLPTIYALSEKNQGKLERRLETIATELRLAIKPTGMTQDDYTRIHQLLYEAAHVLYSSNQESGMGIPRSSRTTAEEAIRRHFD